MFNAGKSMSSFCRQLLKHNNAKSAVAINTFIRFICFSFKKLKFSFFIFQPTLEIEMIFCKPIEKFLLQSSGTNLFAENQLSKSCLFSPMSKSENRMSKSGNRNVKIRKIRNHLLQFLDFQAIKKFPDLIKKFPIFECNTIVFQ